MAGVCEVINILQREAVREGIGPATNARLTLDWRAVEASRVYVNCAAYGKPFHGRFAGVAVQNMKKRERSLQRRTRINIARAGPNTNQVRRARRENRDAPAAPRRGLNPRQEDIC